MIKHTKEFHNKIKKKVFSNPEALAEYKAFALQLDLSEKMKDARKSAKLTQEQVANKMGSKKTVVSRLERSNITKSHSPSVNTLSKFAEAVGKEVKIEFVNRSHAHI
jgi:ribosome-binding protein aMBF1 (putative translation factor)